MARPELGLKRQCMSCGAKFYDLARDPQEEVNLAAGANHARRLAELRERCTRQGARLSLRDS